MNEQHDTTAPALPAMPDFEKAFFDLDEPIHLLSRRLKAADFIFSAIDDRAMFKDPNAAVSISPEERDALHSTMLDAVLSVDALSRQFFETYDAAVPAERAVRERSEGKTSCVEDASASVVPDPLSTMILELRALRAREVEIADRSPVVDAELRPARDATMVVWRRLAHAAPVARTAAGAYLALEEALLDIDVGGGPLAPSLIRSALAYLGSAHVQ